VGRETPQVPLGAHTSQPAKKHGALPSWPNPYEV